MKNSTKLKLAVITGICVSVGIAIGFWGGIGYVVVHFLKKFW